MPELPRIVSGDPCGLIDNSALGKEIVTVSESSNCYIFNIASGLWRDGPSIPGDELVYGAKVAQLNKNFLIFGGQLEGELVGAEMSNIIYEFDAEKYQWLRKVPTVSPAKKYSVVIPVPDYMVDCD